MIDSHEISTYTWCDGIRRKSEWQCSSCAVKRHTIEVRLCFQHIYVNPNYIAGSQYFALKTESTEIAVIKGSYVWGNDVDWVHTESFYRSGRQQ